MTTKYVICYVTDNNDLYSEECETRGAVDKWLAENVEYKAIVVVATGAALAVSTEDRT